MSVFARLSLRTILTSAFLILVLAPLMLVGVSTWSTANRSAEERAATYEGTAANLADKIDRNLFERYGDVQAFGLNHAVRDRNVWYQRDQDNSIVQAMNSYVDTYDIYFLTLLVDPNGKLIAVNTKDHDGEPLDTSFLYDVNFSDESWLADCKREKFYENEDGSFTGTVVEHLYVDENAKRVYGGEGLALGYSAPVFDENGEIIAYWKNVTKFSLVEDIVLASYLELKDRGVPSTEITLLDKDGNVIIDCDPSTTGKESIVRDISIIGKFNLAQKNVESAVEVVAGRSGYLTKSWHARKKIHQVAGYAPLKGALGFPGMQWNVLVRVPCSEALATSIRTKRFTIVVAVTTMVLVSFLAFWISRAISSVLVQTVASMEAATGGDYSHTVKGQLSEDLRRLGSAWNQLLEELTKAQEHTNEASRLRQLVEDSESAIMMVDRDLVINYMNKSSMDLFTQRQEIFRKVWPSFDPTKLIGVCIDQFHKDPSHQRTLLSNPSNLPHKADIKVGPLTLSLSVSAAYDAAGEYIGNTLVWGDVTSQRKMAESDADFRGQIAAISKSMAIIEFDVEGIIQTANDNFLDTLGYRLDEVEGKHHRMFCKPELVDSAEYREHWAKLKQGEPVSGEFERVSKDGREVWIQASYNPIKDNEGNITKVVKYASDISATKEMQRQVAEAREAEQVKAEEQQRKVAGLLEVVTKVADGDLTVTMPDLGDDAIGRVSEGVAKAVEAIRTALVQVQGVAGTVASSANEMASASEQISSGAQEQASSLEETAASLEEITSAVKQNTDNSQQAQQLSISSREIAESGGSVVGDAVEAMTAINGASKKIAEIITTIDEIAFQTNLLALNAAVEAARAGEQGRGFAVVASEVRNLAQRSAAAAKEIKNLIQDSVSKVENGTELVNKSGETLQEIVTSVKRVADIVTEISAASSEQLTGIEQVNGAVSQMDRVTQTNAAQTEEMSGNSQSLLTHAHQLQELVGGFRLGTDVSGANKMPDDKVSVAMKSLSEDGQFDTLSDPSQVHELDLIGVGADGDFEEF